MKKKKRIRKKRSSTFKRIIINIRKNLITGLITALPIYITYVFFVWLMKFFHTKLNFVPQKLFPTLPHWAEVFEILLFTIILAILYLIGVMTNHYFGKRLIRIGDNFLNRIPLIRTIYMGTKQILSSFVVTNKKAFRKVVLIEHPRKGIKSLAFLTSEVKITQKGKKSETLVSVFLPSTPNPTTGFLLLLPRKDIQILDISPENAIKFIISGGALARELKIK